MNIAQAWREMCEWMITYTDGGNAMTLILAIAAAVYLLLFNREIRKKMIFIILLVAVLVINPVLYIYLYQGNRYWRMFWILQETVLIGACVADICRRIKKPVIKCLLLTAAVVGILLTGQNGFTKEGWFIEAQSPYKLYKETAEVCDLILADDPHPKCIIESQINCETRQYSGEIIQLWGRHGPMYERSNDTLNMYLRWNREPKQWDALFQNAGNRDVGYVCVDYNDTIPAAEAAAAENGYELLGEAGGRVVFRKTKSPN